MYVWEWNCRRVGSAVLRIGCVGCIWFVCYLCQVRLCVNSCDGDRDPLIVFFVDVSGWIGKGKILKLGWGFSCLGQRYVIEIWYYERLYDFVNSIFLFGNGL